MAVPWGAAFGSQRAFAFLLAAAFLVISFGGGLIAVTRTWAIFIARLIALTRLVAGLLAIFTFFPFSFRPSFALFTGLFPFSLSFFIGFFFRFLAFSGRPLISFGPWLFALLSLLALLALLALLGVVQLAIPCVLAVRCGRVLKAPEMALLGLLEVIFGILLAWLGAGERPDSAVLTGGALVIGALVFNELLGWKEQR